MNRTKPLSRSDGKSRLTVHVKPKKCKARDCRKQFTPHRAIQPYCGYACEVKAATLAVEKKAAKLRAEDKRKTRAQLEALKGVPKLKKEAQEAFNDYVRFRDAGKGCFVCHKPLRKGGLGGGFDAGHIRSRGQADHLRFDERNVHGQCKECNAPGATKDHEMRAAAERLLGKEAADALYADNEPIKWKRDQLREIRDSARARVQAMKVRHD